MSPLSSARRYRSGVLSGGPSSSQNEGTNSGNTDWVENPGRLVVVGADGRGVITVTGERGPMPRIKWGTSVTLDVDFGDAVSGLGDDEGSVGS